MHPLWKMNLAVAWIEVRMTLVWMCSYEGLDQSNMTEV